MIKVNITKKQAPESCFGISIFVDKGPGLFAPHQINKVTKRLVAKMLELRLGKNKGKKFNINDHKTAFMGREEFVSGDFSKLLASEINRAKTRIKNNSLGN